MVVFEVLKASHYSLLHPTESRYPEQVNVETISFSYSEDPRPGYLEAGSAVVNISWEPPVGELYHIPRSVTHLVFHSISAEYS